MTLQQSLEASVALETLRKQIEEAEETHIAAGLVVETCEEWLDLARKQQDETRHKLMELRAQRDTLETLQKAMEEERTR